jgi:hypothetical protein
MADGPLNQALAKVTEGDVAVDAPEWSDRNGLALTARLIVAVLLFGLVVAVLWNVRDALPGEHRRDDVSAAFSTRATEATAATAVALEARRNARGELLKSRATLKALRNDPSSTLEDRRDARDERNADQRVARDARRVYRQRLQERSSALSDVLAASPSSDVDLVRAIGVGALALIALIAAGALLAPRSQLLSVRRVHAPVAPLAAAGQVAQTAAGGAGNPGASPAGTDGLPPSASFTKSEPALTQGAIAAVALAAGLFGIQETEGFAEIVLNIALPLVPIVAAMVTRARVVPRPNLSPDERVRLFGR